MRIFKGNRHKTAEEAGNLPEPVAVDNTVGKVATGGEVQIEAPAEPRVDFHKRANEQVAAIVGTYERFLDNAYESSVSAHALPQMTADAINGGALPRAMREPQIGTMTSYCLVTFDGTVPADVFAARYFVEGGETMDGGTPGDVNYQETELLLAPDVRTALTSEDGGWRFGEQIQWGEDCTIGLTEVFSVNRIHTNTPTMSPERLADIDARIPHQA